MHAHLLANQGTQRAKSFNRDKMLTTAIFLNGVLLFTVKMYPAQAKQAMQNAFSDSGELPLVFAEVPVL